jgi:hypothetical protein
VVSASVNLYLQAAAGTSPVDLLLRIEVALSVSAPDSLLARTATRSRATDSSSISDREFTG